MATRNSRHPIKEDSSMPLSLPERQAVVREFSSEEHNLEVPLGTAFENAQNKFSHTGLDRCKAL